MIPIIFVAVVLYWILLFVPICRILAYRLTGWSTESGCSLNMCGSFEEIQKRFASLPEEERRTKESWKKLLKRMVSSTPIVMFAKSYCTQSSKLQALLHDVDADFTQVVRKVSADMMCRNSPVCFCFLEISPAVGASLPGPSKGRRDSLRCFGSSRCR